MMNYKHAGVASTFSPTFAAVLAEARSFAARCQGSLEVIHAAARDAGKEKRFQDVLGASIQIRWAEGDSPVEAILSAVESFRHTLLIAGALRKEDDERLYTSSVARGLLRGARCDLLLLPRPLDEPGPLRRLVFVFDPGEDCVSLMERTMQTLQPEHVTVVVNETPFAAAIAASRGEKPHDAQEWLEQSTAIFRDTGIEVETRIVTSNTGYNLCDVIQALEADLLVVKAQSGNGGPLPKHLDWLYQVIPTRLLVVNPDSPIHPTA